MKKGTVFVGLSGGVDSAVSAALLVKQGFDVVGVFIKTWHPDFLECNEEEERRDAMRIAAHLDIAFLTFNLEAVYKKEVGDYMIAEYRAGRTPNPDVMCNKEVKFGAFLKKALSMGADYVATGHYARVDKGVLKKGIDPSKDQSYFLWALNKKQLAKVLFPVGNLKKTEVRALAKKLKLPVAEKKDSQGICFLGPVDLKVFLKHYIKEKKGKVLNELGEAIGHHSGVTFFTLGERHGFTITKKTPNDKPYYIIAKDIKKNTLIVGHEENIPSKSNLSSSDSLANFSRRRAAKGFSPEHFPLRLSHINWISEKPNEGKNYMAQIRYHGEFLNCVVKKKEVLFNKPILAAPGQSVVVYDGEVCLGGGVVI